MNNELFFILSVTSSLHLADSDMCLCFAPAHISVQTVHVSQVRALCGWELRACSVLQSTPTCPLAALCLWLPALHTLLSSSLPGFWGRCGREGG